MPVLVPALVPGFSGSGGHCERSHGTSQGVPDAEVQTRALAPGPFQPHVLARNHPVYFGMMAAVYTPAGAKL